MKKSRILALSGIIALILYVFLPFAYKFFSFLIPAIALSTCLSDKKFNITLFSFISLLTLLFPSSFFSLDALSAYDYIEVVSYFENTINVVFAIFAFAIPILILAGSIYAFIIGNVESGTSGIVKLVVLITVVVTFIFVGSIFDLPMPALLDGVTDFLQTIWDAIQKTIESLTDANNDWNWLTGAPDIPEMPEEADLTLLLDSMVSNGQVGYAFASIMPFILSIICIFFSIVYWKQNKAKKTEKEVIKIEKLIMKYSDENVSYFNEAFKINISYIIFLFVILICSFALFLNYNEELMNSYQNTGFFTIYLLITSVCCIFLSIGVGTSTKISRKSLIGIVYGVCGLFIFFNLFNQVQTLSALQLDFSNLNVNRLISTFLFVAPTESLLFHVFLPSFTLFLILKYNNRYNEDEIKEKIEKYNLKKVKFEIEADIYSNQKSTELYQKAKKNLYKTERAIRKQQNFLTQSNINRSDKVSNNQLFIYYIAIIAFNFLFSTFHFFNSSLSFGVFWNSGLGIIYLGSGCWISYISYQYGWIAGILTHAINNSIGILLIILLVV